jgi:hypothetical protein
MEEVFIFIYSDEEDFTILFFKSFFIFELLNYSIFYLLSFT